MKKGIVVIDAGNFKNNLIGEKLNNNNKNFQYIKILN